MHRAQLNQQFDQVLEPLGPDAADFFLAANLYHSKKVSFESAAALARLSFEAFHQRLQEHFGSGYRLDDEVISEDIQTAETLSQQR